MKKYFTDLIDFVGSRPQPFKSTKNYVSTGALKTDYISLDDTEIIEYNSRPSRADLEVIEGDILFAKMAYTDKRLLVSDKDSNHIYSTGFFAVRPKQGILTSKCLYFLLKSETFKNQKDSNSTGATQKSITIEGLKKIEVRIPEYHEQKEIERILEYVERVVKYKTQQLSSYDLLIKSRFFEIFGDPIKNGKQWDLKSLDEVCDVRDGTHDSPKYLNVGYPLITSKNISSGSIDYSTAQLICEEDYQKINQRSKVDNGDILMPMIGTVGGAVIVDKKQDFAIKNVALIKFNTEMVGNVFIKYVLNSDQMNLHFEDLKKGGTQKFIGLKTIRNLPIILPSIQLQTNFALFIERVDKLKFNVQKSLEETQILFDSLMQKYFG